MTGGLAMSGSWRAAWFIVRVLLVIFAISACWTADYINNGGSWLVAGLVWAAVIAAIVVFFMGIGYLADRTPKRAGAPGYPPGGMPYGMAPYQVPAQPLYMGPRPCRFCDAYLYPPSPICPKCGRKN
jgi:hypothetical protein